MEKLLLKKIQFLEKQLKFKNEQFIKSKFEPKGYLYVGTDDIQNKNISKIGFTNDINNRKKQLSTGNKEGFNMLYYEQFTYHKHFEKLLKDLMKDHYHFDPKKEYYNVHTDIVEKLIKQSKKYENEIIDIFKSHINNENIIVDENINISVNENIVINENPNICQHIIQSKNKNDDIYINFIMMIKNEHPNWYKSNQKIYKDIVYQEFLNFNKLTENDCPKNIFWRTIKSRTNISVKKGQTELIVMQENKPIRIQAIKLVDINQLNIY